MQTKIKPIYLDLFSPLLAPRSPVAHKGLFGHVLAIGGDYGMAGAVRLAGEAAARAGAGLVTIATRPEHITGIISACPELLCYGIKQNKDLTHLLARATVAILGPGLGQSLWSKNLFKQAITTALPKIIDADALNLLAKNPIKRHDWILTPHPGEAARLLNCTTAEIQAERAAAAFALQKKFGGIVVLKGAGTIIYDGCSASICHAGNPGMASGGMGDVLSGVVGGLLAQGLTLLQAVEVGVCLHAAAGDLAAANGERGMLAHDLMPFIRKLVNLKNV